MAFTPGKKGVNPFAKKTSKKDEDMKGKEGAKKIVRKPIKKK